MKEQDVIPEVRARVARELLGGELSIIVDDCPFCHGQHNHKSRQTSGNLGQRTADCFRGEYILVVSEEK